MKKNLIVFASMILSSLVIFNSCKKKEVDNETQSVVDNALCEQQFMSIGPLVNSKGTDPAQAGFRTSSCGDGLWLYPNASSSGLDTTINPSTGAYTYSVMPTFTIDYSGTTCPDIDNVVKKGKIFITPSHKWSAVKTFSTVTTHTTTVTLDNYTVDGIKMDGVIKLIKTGNIIRTIVIGGHCSNSSEGWDIYYEADKTTQISNDGQTISIWGESNGTTRDGRNFTTSISSSNPIIKKRNCKWISQGSISLTPEGFKTRIVDFGDGTCDNDATFTVNGQTISFKLQ